MGVFRFKRFEVRNELSAMKVNTDGVLLGAAATLDFSDRRILDVGTGTGTIALMLAQRYDDMGPAALPEITGIDIDAPSASEASENFAGSPWSGCLQCINSSLQNFRPEEKFDLIVSNPPYFEKDLQAPESRRNAARHGDSTLSYEDIIAFAAKNLTDSGRLSLILPSDRRMELVRTAAAYGLRPFRVLNVRTGATKPVTRSIVELSGTAVSAREEELVMTEKGRNTSQYLSLVSDFYLFTD